jgi:hypothetical protein
MSDESPFRWVFKDVMWIAGITAVVILIAYLI